MLLAGQAPGGEPHGQVIGPKAQVGELEGVPELLGQGSFHPLHLGQEGVNHLVPSGGDQLLCGDVRPGHGVKGVGPLDLLQKPRLRCAGQGGEEVVCAGSGGGPGDPLFHPEALEALRVLTEGPIGPFQFFCQVIEGTAVLIIAPEAVRQAGAVH